MQHYNQADLFSWSLLQRDPVLISLDDYGLEVVSWGGVCMGVKLARLIAAAKIIRIQSTPRMIHEAVVENYSMLDSGAIPKFTHSPHFSAQYSSYAASVLDHVRRESNSPYWGVHLSPKLGTWFDSSNAYHLAGRYNPKEIA